MTKLEREQLMEMGSLNAYTKIIDFMNGNINCNAQDINNFISSEIKTQFERTKK